MKKAVLYIVIPVFNESLIISETIKLVSEKMESLIAEKLISSKSKILFVDDGSKDDTWVKIKNSNCKFIEGIRLSTNFGQQSSLYAGYMYAKNKADVVISMDADLQDDLNVIKEMLDNYYNNYDIVYGVRSSRKKDFFLKRLSAAFFYRLIRLIGVKIVYNHGDYRLVSKRVLDKLEEYGESDLFLRGIFPLMGFNSTKVYYERQKRIGGKSKYSLHKMFSFAWNSITSFSIKPLRFITFIGTVILLISLIFFINYFYGSSSSTDLLNISIWFIGGVQLLSLGIIGEYIGKIYKETKHRPRYIIDEIKEKK